MLCLTLLSYYIGIRWGPSRVREVLRKRHNPSRPDPNKYTRASSSITKNNRNSTSSRRLSMIPMARTCHVFSEKCPTNSGVRFDPAHHILIKQTYTVFVDTTRGQRKWHLSKHSRLNQQLSPQSFCYLPSRLFHGRFNKTVAFGR
jgi:hypothetical protein